MFGQHSARENADAETQIPSGEIGGSGRAALGVGAKVDEQGIESWKSQTESQTATQGDQQEGHRRVIRTQSIDMVAHTQTEHGQNSDDQTHGYGPCHLATVDHLARKQARGNQADGIDGEEQAAADGQAHLFGIQRDIVGNLPVSEGQQRERNARQQAFQQDETVQGNRGTLDGRTHPMLDSRSNQGGQQTASHAAQENGIKAKMFIHKQSRHRTDRHGDVVGHAKIANALSPMLRWHHIDDQGVAAHRSEAKSQAMHDADDY